MVLDAHWIPLGADSEFLEILRGFFLKTVDVNASQGLFQAWSGPGHPVRSLPTCCGRTSGLWFRCDDKDVPEAVSAQREVLLGERSVPAPLPTLCPW